MKTPFSAKNYINKEEPKDLGFGSSLDGRQTRLINQDGTLNVRKRGAGYGAFHPYLALITLPWWQFLLVVAAYLVINCGFAFLYMLIGLEELSGAIEDASLPFWEGFSKSFYFSAQTFTTVGYGYVSPVGPKANFISALEALLGLMSVALATGVFYGRFSRPSARVKFSSMAVVAPYHEINGLMFRLANERPNQLIELEIQVLFAYHEEVHGELKQRFNALPLERSTVTMLPTTWTVVHPIVDESPFFGKDADELERMNAEVLIILKAYDDSFAQHVHTRFSYKYHNIHWGKKFRKIFDTNEDGMLEFDLRRMDETEDARLNITVSRN